MYLYISTGSKGNFYPRLTFFAPFAVKAFSHSVLKTKLLSVPPWWIFSLVLIPNTDDRPPALTNSSPTHRSVSALPPQTTGTPDTSPPPQTPTPRTSPATHNPTQAAASPDTAPGPAIRTSNAPARTARSTAQSPPRGSAQNARSNRKEARARTPLPAASIAVSPRRRPTT